MHPFWPSIGVDINVGDPSGGGSHDDKEELNTMTWHFLGSLDDVSLRFQDEFTHAFFFDLTFSYSSYLIYFINTACIIACS